MTNITNTNFNKLNKNYLFTTINQKVQEYQKNNPKKRVISLGVGDVSLPLCKGVVEVMNDCLNEQLSTKTFKGYPPEIGYDFLRQDIANYYKQKRVNITSDEVFVSSGAGCDLGNLLDLFKKCEVVIADPTYPAYLDSSVMCGHKIKLLSATKENNFLIKPKGLKNKSYIVYLCSPNNPTGATFSFGQLGEWVEFANKTGSIIIYDIAYEMFIEGSFPRSIYEIKGAQTCAIEVGSFSKMAGFTNIRCSWTVVPNKIIRSGQGLNQMWNRRQCTKFNGVPYFVQKGASFVLSEEGLKDCKLKVEYYKQNATIIKQCLKSLEVEFLESSNSPYVWARCPKGITSWQMFDLMLSRCGVVCVPGVGFGKSGEGYVRLSGLGGKENTMQACKRLKKLFK